MIIKLKVYHYFETSSSYNKNVLRLLKVIFFHLLQVFLKIYQDLSKLHCLLSNNYFNISLQCTKSFSKDTFQTPKFVYHPKSKRSLLPRFDFAFSNCRTFNFHATSWTAKIESTRSRYPEECEMPRHCFLARPLMSFKSALISQLEIRETGKIRY